MGWRHRFAAWQLLAVGESAGVVGLPGKASPSGGSGPTAGPGRPPGRGLQREGSGRGELSLVRHLACVRWPEGDVRVK